MKDRIVEIARDGVHLSVERGFLTVRETARAAGQREAGDGVSAGGVEVGRIAIADIGALIIRGHGASFSVNVCARLAEAGVPVVLCDASQSPASLLWPVQGHYEQGRRMQAQADAAKPLKKRLWKQLVQAKIRAQADVLALLGLPDARLRAHARDVKSGDASNIEGQAARRYWPLLMGETFRRHGDGDFTNAALNYGYTILRAATARSVLAAGLHPSLSIHHESDGDAFRLCDDLMEPFRPFVDLEVHRLRRDDPAVLDRDRKAALVKVLTLDLQGPRGARPLQSCIDYLALSLSLVYAGAQTDLDLPSGPTPLSAAGG